MRNMNFHLSGFLGGISGWHRNILIKRKKLLMEVIQSSFFATVPVLPLAFKTTNICGCSTSSGDN